MPTITVERRFCGPPTSGNGGYVSGRLAGFADQVVSVRLLRPPPLDVPLAVEDRGDGVLELRQGEEVFARATPAKLTVPDVSTPGYLLAVEASRRCPGLISHPFPTCFVCGPRRGRGDGLRIFPGPVPGTAQVAAPWVADASLDAGDGKVRPEFMWAALDCPGWFASVPLERIALLGELTAHVDRRVHIDEICTVIGWPIARDGRKHQAGTALFDEDGELCAYARATWVQPRAAAGASGAGA